jgi:hypothetical protein
MERKINNQSAGGSIILKCKDFHIYQLDFGSVNDLVKVAQTIEKLSCLGIVQYNKSFSKTGKLLVKNFICF